MYNAKEVEEEVLKFWNKNKIYNKIKNKNKNGKNFYFLQGPPYTSGKLHIGQAWNNCLKDILLRYKRMNGYNVYDRAGYDMHGLPTENKVQKNLGLKDKDDIVKYGVDKFVKECLEFSTKTAKQMDQDLLRLGVWLDYSDPYYPIKDDFIEGEWFLIKKAYNDKRLYKGKKVMHWCASCETALAKHELEYENVKDKSIFFKLQLKDKKNEYLAIWTTTPWTTLFNLAVMVNPDLDYVKAKVDNEVWIIAKALAGPFIKGVMNKDFKVLEEFKGKKLEGLSYTHPFYDELKKQFDNIKSKNLHSVVLSTEYVNLESGTGLVHCAPGCGMEDFEVGKEYGLAAFNNIDERGIFRDMGKFSSLIAKKDDDKFIEALENKKALLAITQVEHEYPLCWRCKNPVVFRATEQWFLKIEDLINKMIEDNKKVHWEPKFGKTTFNAWIRSLKDNSITRQRFWGSPVPIWECNKCKNIIIVDSKDELEKLSKRKVSNLHKPWIDEVKIKCKCGNLVSRIPDILDVWLDSGTTSWNSLYYPKRKDLFKKFYPADFILEATEQIKLWFSMLSICSSIVFKKSCYKNVYMHGMILDYQGMKMSKSLGNIISPYEIVDKYSADILRYYICSTTAGENINFNWESIKIKQRNLLVLWNLHNYLIEILNELKIKPEKIKPKLNIEEKYILSKLNSTIKKVTELLESYRIDESIPLIEELYLELSRTYIQQIRDKLSVGSDKEKLTVYYTIYNVLVESLKLLSIICPFVTEKIYLNLKKEFKLKKESIHLHEWPKYNKKLINEKLENNMKIAKQVIQEILAEREKIQLGIRWPLREAVIKTQHDKELKDLIELIKTQTNIKNIRLEISKKFSIKLDSKLTKELEQEGYSRELSRRIQALRKKVGLKKQDKINLNIEARYDLGEFLNEVKEKVNAKRLDSKRHKNYSKESIKGQEFNIYFEKI